MKTILKFVIILVLFVLTKIVYLVEGSYVMLPVTTFVIIGLLVYEYLLIRIAVKNGKAICLEKRNKSRWSTIIFVLVGIGFIMLGLGIHVQSFSYWGADSISYFGLIIIAIALTSVKTPVILFKERDQKKTYYLVIPQLTYKRIDKVIIGNKSLVIESKNSTVNYDFLDESQRTTIQNFVKELLA